MDPKDKEAKMNVLRHLHQMMSSAMGDSLKHMNDEDHPLEENMPLKKVTVASDSKEGLQHGLQKAEDLVTKHGEMGDSSHEEPEDDEMLEAAEPEEDEDDLDRQIQDLHAKKAALAAKRA